HRRVACPPGDRVRPPTSLPKPDPPPPPGNPSARIAPPSPGAAATPPASPRGREGRPTCVKTSSGRPDSPALPPCRCPSQPTSPYTADEADRLRQWVRDSGGLLIYASEQGDPELDRSLGVSRFDGFAGGGRYAATAPTLAGVTAVSGGDAIVPLDPSATQVPLLRTPDGFVAGYVQQLGIGHVVVLADPLV